MRLEEAGQFLTKAIAGETSLKTGLSEMQQFFQNREDEARQNMR